MIKVNNVTSKLKKKSREICLMAKAVKLDTYCTFLSCVTSRQHSDLLL